MDAKGTQRFFIIAGKLGSANDGCFQRGIVFHIVIRKGFLLIYVLDVLFMSAIYTDILFLNKWKILIKRQKKYIVSDNYVLKY